MAVDIVMPQMGESIFEGTITKWLKKPGDKVERDEPLFEISTDKVDAEIPSPSAGVLKEIKVGEGQTVPIQTIVGVIDAAGSGCSACAGSGKDGNSRSGCKNSCCATAIGAGTAACSSRSRSAVRGGCRHTLASGWRPHSQLAARAPDGQGTWNRSRCRAGHRRRRAHQQTGHRGGDRRRRCACGGSV